MKARIIFVLVGFLLLLGTTQLKAADASLSDLNIRIEGNCFSAPDNSGSPPEGAKIVTLENKNSSKRISARVAINGSSFYYINNNGNYRTYPHMIETSVSLLEGGSEVIGCTRRWVSQKTPKTLSYSDPIFTVKSARYIEPEAFHNEWRGEESFAHLWEQPVASTAFLLDYSTECPAGESGRNVRLLNLHSNRIIHVEVRVNYKKDLTADLYPGNATKLIGCEIAEGGPQNFRVKAAKFLSGPLSH